MKRVAPVIFLSLFVTLFLFKETFTQGFVPVPADTLVGSYFPWLDYKWGYQVGVPVKNPPISDVFSQFFVWKHQLINIFKQGAWPLWNHNSFLGTPLLATYHSSALFPANLLFLLPKFWGWSIYIASSTLVAMLGMHLFISRWVSSRLARITAAIIFALAGPMTTWSEFGTGVWAAAMLPLILYLIDRVILAKKYKLLPVVGITTASLIFAGHAQLDTYTAVLIPIYIIFRLRSAKVNKTALFFWFSLFGALGVGLAAIQLLPALDFQSISIRTEENYAAGFNYGLTPILEIVRLWAADFFGHPATYNHFSPTSYHEYSSFLSTLSLPFIIALVFAKKKCKTVKFFLSVFFLSLSLLVDNPLSKLIFSLPLPLFTYSSASRLLFLTTLSSAALVPLGFQKLNSFKFRHYLSIISSLLILITLLAILLIDPQHRLISFRNSILPVCLLICFIGLLKLKLKTNIIALVLLTLFSFDLGRYFRKYNPQVPRHLVFPTTPVIDFLTNQKGVFRIARQRGPLLPPNTWIYYNLSSVEGYDPLRLLTVNHYFHLLENRPYLNKPSRYSELEDINPKFLAASNVKYFLTLKENKNLIKYGFKPVFADGSVTVLENPDVLPRAYFVKNLIETSTESDLIKKIEDPSFDPRSTAVILTQNSQQLKLKPGEVKNINYQPNTVTLDLKLKDQGFMILSDAFSPGWQAKLNGQDIKIHQVNGGVKGVFLPAGEHRLIFNYLPKSFVLGLKISLISLAILIISLIY